MNKNKALMLVICFCLLIHLQAETVKITILNTTDIHGHVLSGYHQKEGNWLKLATVLKKQEKLAGGHDHSLIIDCGDTIQGSMLGQHSGGNVSVDIMNMLGVDIWVLGNHDYEFGIDTLGTLIKRYKGTVLAGNLQLKNDSFPIKSWILIQRNGAKIAVIGMTSPYLNKWLWGSLANRFQVENMDSALQKIIPQVMKQKPDMIILAIHHGEFAYPDAPNNAVRYIATTYPQIDLILGGHTHQEEPGKKIGASTWYVQAGKHAESLAVITAEVDLKDHQVKQIKSKIVRSDSAVEDPELKKSLKAAIKAYVDYKKTPIGNAPEAIHPIGEKAFNGELNDLFSMAIAEAANCQIAFHATIKPFVLNGQITEESLFMTIPYDDTVGTLMLTESELIQVLNEQFAPGLSNRYQAPWGIFVKINDKNQVVGPIQLSSDKTLTPGKRYKVAFNSYVLAGAGNRFPVLHALAESPKCQPHDTGISIRDALRSYIKKNSPIKIPKTNWVEKITK